MEFLYEKLELLISVIRFRDIANSVINIRNFIFDIISCVIDMDNSNFMLSNIRNTDISNSI